MTKPNTHADTGTAFGVISSQVLDTDLVVQLLYGSQITNHSYQLQKAEAILKARRDAMDAGKPFTQDDEEEAIEEFSERFSSDEDFITGTWQGVEYGTSWFGGVLHFIIMTSPFTASCSPCSPCVPGAGDLHTANESGTLRTYDVPPTWRE